MPNLGFGKLEVNNRNLENIWDLAHSNPVSAWIGMRVTMSKDERRSAYCISLRSPTLLVLKDITPLRFENCDRSGC